MRYAQRPPANNLSEIVIDAGITGEYPQIMKFINSIERDKIFFVITGMSLTGQQAGAVNLRLADVHLAAPGRCRCQRIPPGAGTRPATGSGSGRNSGRGGPAAMKVGTEDKKKVILVAVLFAIIVPAAIWEVYGYFAAPSQPPRPAAVAITPRTRVAPVNQAPAPTENAPAAPEAERVGGMVIDPTLHLEKLAQSEDVEYEGTGRNIFSAESAPVRIRAASRRCPPTAAGHGPPGSAASATGP